MTNQFHCGVQINTMGYEFNAYISPDDSFLIFTGYNREHGLGSGNLYMNFRHLSGWSNAVNPGIEYNSPQMDNCPFVDLEYELLYFTSRRSLLYYNQGSFKRLRCFMTEVNSYQNGISRIYRLPFKIAEFHL